MKTCDGCTLPEVCQTSGWCHRAKEKADDRLALTPCSALLARIEGMDVRKVAASTQYGMGLVIVIEGAKHLMSGIAYRNDEMTHADRVALAEEANIILRQNAESIRHHHNHEKQ